MTARSAPVLIFQRSDDPIVPASRLQELAREYDATDVPERLATIPKVRHSFGVCVGHTTS